MNTLNRALLATVSAGLLCAVSPGLAEDIDIYAAETGTESNPNILIVVDNSANWANSAQHWPDGLQQGQSELNAIRNVVSELGGDVNVGLMLFTEGVNASNPNGPGGYVRFHLRPMSVANKTGFIDLIGNPAGCTEGPNAINTTPDCIYQNFIDPREKVGTAKLDYSAMMFEAFKYFGGYTSPAHATDDVAGTPTSASQFGPYRYAGSPDPKSDPYAFTVETRDTTKAEYTQVILDAQNCAKNYIIFIGNGLPLSDSPCSLLEGVGGDCTQLPMPDFVTEGTTESPVLETAACGTYDSIESCEAAAAIKYGTAYDTYTCTEKSTCSAGTEVTTTEVIRTSACGEFADLEACEASLPEDTATTTYACQELSSSCPYEAELSPAQILASPSVCIANTVNPQGTVFYESACIAWALNEYPAYSQLSCTKPLAGTCPNKAATWTISAAASNETGKTFTLTQTTTTINTEVTTSYEITGTRTVTEVEETGTFTVPTGSDIRHADEWAQFLNRTDVSIATGQQNVQTYTIDVFNEKQDVDLTALLLSMAKAGGGKYFAAKNEDAIKTALQKVLAEIQSVNSVFASSSLPVSVNTQGTYLNQVFIGMFRPDGSAAPRWAGNLKQYQFYFFSGEMKLADDNDEEAISATTGFITPCADSVWTSDSGLYWDYPDSQAIGSCTAESSQFPSAGTTSFYSDAPDGDVVEKGGAAQRLRGAESTGTTLTSSTTNYETRNLKTCNPLATPACGTLTDFNDGNTSITALALGVTNPDPTVEAQARTDLIEWVRGKDVDDENGNGLFTEVRPSVHGGVIHSQPAVVDYGTTTGVIAYYGGDDGVLHAITGKALAGYGDELWGFIAPETYGRLKRLKVNEPLVAFPNLGTVVPAPEPKDYFFDGSIGVLQSPGKTWIFPTMRRGGRAIYAFDVTTPTSPLLKWRKGCFTNSTSDDTSCATGWSGIGQTWSKPQIAYLDGYEDTDADGIVSPRPVLIFGGGYDTCEDADTTAPSCPTAPKGANIWFVDALDGTVLRTYPTLKSVPGDVAVLKDGLGNATHVYATDLGGNLYRINVGTYDGSTFSGWTDNSSASGIQIASLADGQTRKFLFGPDVVPYKDYTAVLAGTGDRERPLWNNYPCNSGLTGGVQNRFYMVKDVGPTYPSPVVVYGDLLNVTDRTDVAISELDAKKGWAFDLHPCEQVVNKPLTFAGTVYFGTNQPVETGTACGRNLGIARGYMVNFLTGNPVNEDRYVEYVGGGLPPSPVAGVVDVDGVKVPFVIGGGKKSALEGGEVVISPPARRTKSYWYKESD